VEQSLRRGTSHKICAGRLRRREPPIWGCPPGLGRSPTQRDRPTNQQQEARFQFTRAKLSDNLKRPAETDATPRLASPQPDGRGMVMVALRLQHEALQQKRDAVVALAHHAARNAVKRQLQAEGTKVALVPYSVISAQASAYLRPDWWWSATSSGLVLPKSRRWPARRPTLRHGYKRLRLQAP